MSGGCMGDPEDRPADVHSYEEVALYANGNGPDAPGPPPEPTGLAKVWVQVPSIGELIVMVLLALFGAWLTLAFFETRDPVGWQPGDEDEWVEERHPR